MFHNFVELYDWLCCCLTDYPVWLYDNGWENENHAYMHFVLLNNELCCAFTENYKL